MRSIRSLFTMTALFVAIPFIAQSVTPKITFNTVEHDFGSISESAGKVSTTFEFTNLGSQPLIIQSVSASCGCTSPEWSKAPVLPGAKGFIKATFDPSNRPGAFHKTITVNTNAEPKTSILKIVGKVTPKEPTIEDKFPYVFGDLRLKKSHISFLKMTKDDVNTSTFEVINTSSDKAITLGFQNVPTHLKVSSFPEKLEPGKQGTITIVYDATLQNDWGFILDRVMLKQNGEVDYNHRLGISVTIEEDFTKLSSKELKNAPVATFDSPNFNFGSITEGEKVTHNFKLTNEGKSNLLIRKIKPSCGCTAVVAGKTVIEPGETTDIKAVFASKGRRGRQYKSISVITNAPSNQLMTLRITGDVK